MARRPASDDDLRRWLVNMVGYHRYRTSEVADATGLSPAEIEKTLARWQIAPGKHPPRAPADPLTLLPYPGGRHPRIGFLEGAIRPRRETKLSVFAPWEDSSYVVLDVPEAVWSQHGLLYLAHEHVPTIWSKAGVVLEPLEWQPAQPSGWQIERRLPNAVSFRAKAWPTATEVRLELELFNGSNESWSDLRVQCCAMLKAMQGFDEQTNDNKRFEPPFAIAHDAARNHWLVWAWTPCHRAWGNAPCPCLHADPKFADCPPGQTRTVRGWFSFYEGDMIEPELERIRAAGWLNFDSTPASGR